MATLAIRGRQECHGELLVAAQEVLQSLAEVTSILQRQRVLNRRFVFTIHF